MKASELITELQDQIKKHGDRDVYYEHGLGDRVSCYDVGYSKQTYRNKYTAYWGILREVIIINFSI